jgi:nucleotide-binding universal stress UspA family protein
MSYTHILVPLDGSELSELALPHALSFARKMQAHIELVTVLDKAPAPVAPGWASKSAPGRAATAQLEVATEEQPAGYGAQYLNATAAAIENGLAAVSTTMAVGDPASEVLKRAREARADLIVMATRGRSGMVRGLLGSVADRVVLGSSIPVLAIRAELSASSLAQDINRVIVPLDGSELAEIALKHGAAVAAAFRAELTLVRVIGSLESSGERDEAARYLSWASRRLVPALDPELRVVGGDPRAEIVREASEEAGTMIVMSTRGASGFSRWLRGSVADGVLRTASAPTMLVPPTDALLGPAIY